MRCEKMSIFRDYHPIRDAFLALLLLLLIRPALHLSAKRIREEYKLQESSFVHEIDRAFLQTFDVVKNQLAKAMVFAEKNQLFKPLDQLKEMKKTVEILEAKYINNSPGLFFLGPIASVSIVLKELELEKKLKHLVSKLNSTLQALCNVEKKESGHVVSLAATVRSNSSLLSKLTRA